MKFFHPTAVISPHARFYTDKLSIGAHSRIDDGVIITGSVEIGAYVHIGAYSVLHGKGGIKIGDYCGFAAFTVMHSESDDFSGRSMSNPCVPMEYKPFLKSAQIVIGKNVISGTRCTYMPGVTVNDGAAIGAHSLVKDDCVANTIYVGTPAKRIKDRDLGLWKFSEQLDNRA